MSGDDLEQLVAACADSGTFVLLDETYERFDFSGRSRHPWQKSRPRNLLSFGSFSKSHGIPGWRLGYLFGAGDILAQALKVQDSAVICPPSPAQLLLESALAVEGWVEARAAGIRARMDACRGALSGRGRLEWIEPDGGFFTLARVSDGTGDSAICASLLEEAGIAAIPGSAFGPAGRGHVRISFGCLGDGEVAPAMEALRRWNDAGSGRL
jgi:aspartate/methionine/tyrosine aminotransferase